MWSTCSSPAGIIIIILHAGKEKCSEREREYRSINRLRLSSCRVNERQWRRGYNLRVWSLGWSYSRHSRHLNRVRADDNSGAYLEYQVPNFSHARYLGRNYGRTIVSVDGVCWSSRLETVKSRRKNKETDTVPAASRRFRRPIVFHRPGMRTSCQMRRRIRALRWMPAIRVHSADLHWDSRFLNRSACSTG